jgi:hypothetical protein
MTKKVVISSQDVIQKALVDIQHQLKVMDEKSKRMESKLSFEIMSQAAITRKSLENSLVAEIAVSIKESEDNLSQRFTEFSDKMYARNDPILAEVENARIDRVLSTQKDVELEDRIESLEQKIN